MSFKLPRRLPQLIGISGLVIAVDQASKLWIQRHLEIGDFIPVIPHFFRISHWQNEGAAFSFLADTASPQTVRWGLIAFTLAATLVILGILYRLAARFSFSAVALALILGGAVGNLYDRIRFASVTDFLEVHIFSYHWPDFNVADSAIVVGACLLLLDAIVAKPEQKTTSTEQD